MNILNWLFLEPRFKILQVGECVTTEMIKKFFRTCRDYERAYREGLQGKAVEKKVKLYKSHRHVNSSDK